MDERLQETYDKADSLKSAGYTVVTMWECDFNRMKDSDPVIQQFYNDCKLVMRLDPREAFYGGRTGPTKIYHKVEEEEERIDHVDICR